MLQFVRFFASKSFFNSSHIFSEFTKYCTLFLALAVKLSDDQSG